jgi:hypothetical protein
MTNKRKQRTRQHIIADMSVNHAEYFVLKCRFSAERIESDYGYYLQIYCYDENGAFENGIIYLQLKATDTIEKYRKKDGFSYAFESGHMDIWINEPMPVILVLFDAAEEKAYWVYLQAFAESENISECSGRKYFTVRFDENNVVGTEAVRKWKTYKDRILSQLEGYISHDA